MRVRHEIHVVTHAVDEVAVPQGVRKQITYRGAVAGPNNAGTLRTRTQPEGIAAAKLHREADRFEGVLRRTQVKKEIVERRCESFVLVDLLVRYDGIEPDERWAVDVDPC